MKDNDPNRKDPWSRDRNPEGPPDLIELFKKLYKKGSSGGIGGSGPGSESAMRYLGIGAVAFLLLWVLFGIFIVDPAEQAVIQRFGKYYETVGPGIHWIPRFVDTKTVLNVQQVNNFSYSSEMLTRDENIVSVALAVQYRIDNPQEYLFNVVSPDTTIQQATSSALRQVVGTMTLDMVLTTGRQALRDQVAKLLAQIVSSYQMGVEVTDVNMQPIKPPEAVTAAFDDAIKAREDEQRYINKAEAYSRQKIAIAQGQVARLQQSAMAYQKEAVLKAQGETARYLALLKPYEEAPVITRERLYLETVSDVLSRTNNILVDSNGNNVLYLPLDQMIKYSMNKVAALPGDDVMDATKLQLPTPANTDANRTDNSSSASAYDEVTRPSGYPLGRDDQ